MALSSKCIQLFIAFYFLVSIFYTSRHLVHILLDITSKFPISVLSRPPLGLVRGHGRFEPNTTNDGGFDSDIPGFLASLVLHPTRKVFRWPPSDPSNAKMDFGVRQADPFLLEETLLSKAFSQSLHPTRVIPYFYRSTGTVGPDDVTITTLVTSNRFKVLKQLVERYQGPISVTIHVPLPTTVPSGGFSANHPSALALLELHTLYKSSSHFSTYVDVHLALSPFARSIRGNHATTHGSGDGEGGRQFNVWRNVARLFARSEFVMMLDVDFAVCTDWRSAIRDSIRAIYGIQKTFDAPSVGPKLNIPTNKTAAEEVLKNLKNGLAALVIPAFEYVDQDSGKDQDTFPQDKESLLRLVKAKPPVVSSFHPSWAPGHNCTDYPRFYAIPPRSGEIYQASSYQSAYEPYVVTSKEVPWCDERFTGYGGNKAACLFEMYISGVSFYVLADHFLIHQSHTYEEQARREERKYNRKLYTDFKEETCLRYLYRFHQAGTLNDSIATNAVEECKKIKSVSKIASELLGHAL